jgi:hypothetical protein
VTRRPSPKGVTKARDARQRHEPFIAAELDFLRKIIADGDRAMARGEYTVIRSEADAKALFDGIEKRVSRRP